MLAERGREVRACTVQLVPLLATYRSKGDKCCNDTDRLFQLVTSKKAPPLATDSQSVVVLSGMPEGFPFDATAGTHLKTAIIIAVA